MAKFMKKIGIIGGLSPASTSKYYLYLDMLTKKHFGGLYTPVISIDSVNQQELFDLKAENDWQKCGDILTLSAKNLERSGADIILLATNTMHKVADQIEDAINVPFIHIADATGNAIKQKEMNNVGLLGTKYTMNLPFYTDRLKSKFDINVITPDEKDKDIVNTVIFDELCHGMIKNQSKTAFANITQSLENNGAEGVILGCTEIGLLIQPNDCNIPLFDTADIHCEYVFKMAIA